MALFNVLKKILKKDKPEEKKAQKVDFDNLHTWIKDEQKTLEDKGKTTFDTIQQELQPFTKEIGVELQALQNVALDEIKTDYRTKSIVKLNLKVYIGCVDRLTKDITNLSYSNLEEYIFRMDKYFVDFFKKSNVSYQRTAYLGGK